MGDFLPGAVGEGEGEVQGGVVPGGVHRVLQDGAAFGREAFEVSDAVEADVFLHHFRCALFDEAVQQQHEGGDFDEGAVPVFGGEGVECEPGDTVFQAEVDAFLYGLRSFGVSPAAECPFRLAQRPLPSMMMAMWCGSFSCGMSSMVWYRERG